jgi:hypothetical protein
MSNHACLQPIHARARLVMLGKNTVSGPNKEQLWGLDEDRLIGSIWQWEYR